MRRPSVVSLFCARIGVAKADLYPRFSLTGSFGWDSARIHAFLESHGFVLREWERVRTIPVEDAQALARAVEELAVFPRQFSWARERMKDYSVGASAQMIAKQIQEILPA